MKYCPACGTKLSDNSKFCAACGTKMPEAPGATEAQSGEETQSAKETQSATKIYAEEKTQSAAKNESAAKNQTAAEASPATDTAAAGGSEKDTPTRNNSLRLAGILVIMVLIACAGLLLGVFLSICMPSGSSAPASKNTNNTNPSSVQEDETTEKEEKTDSAEKTTADEESSIANEKQTDLSAVPVSGANLSLECISPDWGGYIASIEIRDDFTFSMNVNLYEGKGNLSGTYEFRDDGAIVCFVNYKDFSGFTGNELRAFSIIPKIGNQYSVYLHDVDFLGALESGAIFTS